MNAVLVSGDFVSTGGMDRANLALASFLARSDSSRTVDVVAHRIDPQLRSFPNVRFHRAPKPLNSYLLGSSWLDRIGRRVAKNAANSRVVVNGGNCNFADVNWVHYVHAAWIPNDVDAQPTVKRVKSRWHRNRSLADERAIIPSAKLVIANSQRTKRDLIERVGVAEERIQVVYYGVDPEKFYPAIDDEKLATRRELNIALDRPIVVFVGAIEDRRKNFDTLLLAWRKVNLDAQLLVIGAGDVSRDGNVMNLGFREDVPRILRACDAIVAPSRYEAYGLAVHEAICCGLPAIVSASAGVAERLPASLAPLLINNPDDANELSQRLKTWHGSSNQFRALTESLAGDWRARTWDQMSAEIESLLS